MPERPRIIISAAGLPADCEAVLYAAGADGSPEYSVAEPAAMRRITPAEAAEAAVSRSGQAPAGMLAEGDGSGALVLEARPAVWGLRRYGVKLRNAATGEESAASEVQVFVDAEPSPPAGLEWTGEVVGGQAKFLLSPGVLR